VAIGHIGLNVRFFPFRELTPASEADATEKNRGIRGSPLKLLSLSVIAIFYGIHFRDRVQPHKSLVLPRGDAQQRRPRLVVTIEYLEWTAANHLRHAMFVGMAENVDLL
jgi:hypothetical protein